MFKDVLTDVKIRKLETRDRRYEIHDGSGLYFEVMPSGRKFWRIRMTIGKQVYRRSLGEYPGVSLKEARRVRDDLRLKIAAGDNPFEEAGGRTFEQTAREWLKVKMIPVRSPRHVQDTQSRLERLVFPEIGDSPIKCISPVQLLAVVRKIEARGASELAHKVLQICGQVFRYGVAIGEADRDLAVDLRGALVPAKRTHYPTMTDPAEIGALMRAMEDLNGSPIVRCAVRLQAYCFPRPGELRCAEWSEVDFERKEWRIPGEKMKMKRAHIVPLSRQALAILGEAETYTGGGRYVFPSIRTGDRPMSDMTVNAALRRLGYGKEQLTGHSFRSIASTIMNEHQFNPDVIERSLAHVERNSIRAAYNHAEFLPQRRELMQWWADWLDEQKTAKPLSE